jgi:hypothetical protein
MCTRPQISGPVERRRLLALLALLVHFFSGNWGPTASVQSRDNIPTRDLRFLFRLRLYSGAARRRRPLNK